MSNTAPRYRMFEAAQTHVPKINPELAVEIGLNESLIFQQIAFWISNSEHIHDGRCWVFKSAAQLHEESFPFLSRVTITRALERLTNELHLLDRRDDLNKRKGDRTYWYALNVEYVSRLTSVVLMETPTNVQNEQPNVQNEQPLPDIPTDIKTDDDDARARKGGWPAQRDAAPDAEPDVNIFSLYHATFGRLVSNPLLADDLKDMAAQYPPDWISDAFREAALANATSHKYARRCLENWRLHGRARPQADRPATPKGKPRLNPDDAFLSEDELNAIRPDGTEYLVTYAH